MPISEGTDPVDWRTTAGPDRAIRPEDGASWDESPELLRWRADVLLDEMMLGGVDIATGEARPAPRNGNGVGASGHGQSTNGDHGGPGSDSPGAYTGQASSGDGHYSGMENGVSRLPGASAATTGAPQPGPAPSDFQTSPERRIVSAEQRYQQSSRPGTDSSAARWQAGPSWEPTPPAAAATEEMVAGQVSTPQGQNTVAPDGQLSAYNPKPVSSQQLVNAMSVRPRGDKRSNLLPRMSALNAQALEDEIGVLHHAIDSGVPAGNEAIERARHLLNKAHSILRSDPLRSAEVEYYMQQVRAIVGRIQQTRIWSDVYRSRLHTYLVAWILLSVVGLITCYLYPLHLEVFLADLFGLSTEGVGAGHLVGLLTAAFAGSLGGAVGALLTMQRHSRREHGFFDRKYGLRGLILPVIALLVGCLIYLVIGVIYFLADVDPVRNWLARSLPAILALVFGLYQETLYGTRE